MKKNTLQNFITGLLASLRPDQLDFSGAQRPVVPVTPMEAFQTEQKTNPLAPLLAGDVGGAANMALANAQNYFANRNPWEAFSTGAARTGQGLLNNIFHLAYDPAYDLTRNVANTAQGRPLTTWEANYSPLTRIGYDLLGISGTPAQSGSGGAFRRYLAKTNPEAYLAGVISQTGLPQNASGFTNTVSEQKLLADALNQQNPAFQQFPPQILAQENPPPKTYPFAHPSLPQGLDPASGIPPELRKTPTFDLGNGKIVNSAGELCDPETGLAFNWFDTKDSAGRPAPRQIRFVNGVPCDVLTGEPVPLGQMGPPLTGGKQGYEPLPDVISNPANYTVPTDKFFQNGTLGPDQYSPTGPPDLAPEESPNI